MKRLGSIALAVLALTVFPSIVPAAPPPFTIRGVTSYHIGDDVYHPTSIEYCDGTFWIVGDETTLYRYNHDADGNLGAHPLGSIPIPSTIGTGGLAYDPAREHLWTIHNSGHITDELNKFDRTGELLNRYGTPGASPSGTAYAGAGSRSDLGYTWPETLYTCDHGADRVYRHNLDDGTVVSGFDVGGSGISAPLAIDVDPWTGRLIIADNDDATLGVFEPNGAHVQTLNLKPFGLNNIWGVTVGPDRALYVTEVIQNKVYRFDIGGPPNHPPAVTITGPDSGLVQAVNVPVSLEVTITDPDADDSHTATWTMSNENWTEDLVIPGTVTGNAVSDIFTPQEAGIYFISVTVTDAAGETDTDDTVNDDPERPAFVVIYDPDGGFVTGGGWIFSPAGALLFDEEAEGKASFGFVAKYKKGAEVPQGNTEFHFRAGDFKFKTTSYDWLVVAGKKAKFKGVGEIAGLDGVYGFMLTAVDGAEDRFRIKIWDPIPEDVIYDNQLGDDDSAEPTVLGGGSIVVHKTD